MVYFDNSDSLRIQRLSSRALEGDEQALMDSMALCDGNYPFWASACDRLLMDDSTLTHLVETYPKNYQLWNYISRAAPCKFGLLERAFDLDPKNYHAWQAAMITELQGVDVMAGKLIEDDPLNNSARIFLENHQRIYK
jgi:hypothetical protein